MEKYYQMDKIIDLFKKQFDCILKYESISFELGKAHAFFIEIEDSFSNSSWKEMRNFLAIKFQNTLSNEFERWNIYLFYIVNSSIGEDLKYQIENDTFSSRKIVIEGNSDVTKIIDEHILNSDIKIESSEVSDRVFTPNPLIFNEVFDIEAKLRVTDSLKEAHSKILNKLKEVYHEI
jgi:hypothetical protein